MTRYRSAEFLFLALFLVADPATSDNRGTVTDRRPEVTITQGKLLGKIMTSYQNRDIFAFLGVPYARPPIGQLRFANPVAAGGWTGTFDATLDSNECPQINSKREILGDEDCLYLNLYTPKLPDGRDGDSSLLPVMVFVHGGAFQSGSQVSKKYGPEYLLDEDVVLVTMNYRLGPLGFLSTGDRAASGNWGLKDQVLALRWVQENIIHFGGDADSVTLFGQSVGATSVHLLSLSNSTIGLFHRFITQSGSALATWAHRPRSPYSSRAFELGRYVGCWNETTDSLIGCLRTIDARDVVATQSRFFVWQYYPDIVWGPTDEPEGTEGAVITESPTNLFADGNVRDLPWISGVVRDEGLLQTLLLYEDEKILADFLEKIDLILPSMLSLTYQPDSGAAWVEAMKSYYLKNEPSTTTVSRGNDSAGPLLSSISRMTADCHFVYPAYDALRRHNALAKNPQYFYTFDYRGAFSKTQLYGDSAIDYGVYHGDEQLYIFPPYSLLGSNLTRSESDSQIVRTMVQLWTSFAKNGTPAASGPGRTLTWEPYSAADGYLRIGDGPSPVAEVRHSFLAERMQFWTALNEKTSCHSGAETSSPTCALGLAIFALADFIPSA